MVSAKDRIYELFQELDAQSLATVCAALDVAAGRINHDNEQAGTVDEIDNFLFGIGASKYGEDNFNTLCREAGKR